MAHTQYAHTHTHTHTHTHLQESCMYVSDANQETSCYCFYIMYWCMYFICWYCNGIRNPAHILFLDNKVILLPECIIQTFPVSFTNQGKEMIEMYFDFRLYRLWKTRQHSKLLDYEDFLWLRHQENRCSRALQCHEEPNWSDDWTLLNYSARPISSI